VSKSARSLAASIAANTRWSRESGVVGTERARSAGPGRIDYWLAQVDPGGELPHDERLRRAERAKRAHFQRLALASAKARRRST
jgi:hypothetical protein